MAWDLNGSNQYAQFTMSAALKAATGGPFTFGAIVNLDSAVDGALIHMMDGTSGRHFMEIFGTFNFGTAAAAKLGPTPATGTWYHVILTKDTGAVVPEYTITPLATGTPTSGSCTGGTLANGAAPGAAGVIQVGRFGTSASEYVDGKVAALWCHASYKNQAAREALTTWALAVTAASASGLGWAVRLDTLSTITDATGGGGGETGRFGTTPFTLSADPSGSFFGGSTVSAVMSATLPAPTAAAVATLRHPATLAAVAAAPVAALWALVRHMATLSATLPAPVAVIVKDSAPRVTATLTPGAVAAAVLTPGAGAGATLATGSAATATLIADTL